jgi:hypothetical protein
VSRKSSGFAASGQNPMARDNESDWIPSQSLSNDSGCGGPAQGFGKLAVCPGLPRWDFSSGFVHLPRKRPRSFQVNRDVAEILNFTMEMLAYFLDDLGNLRWGYAQFARPRVQHDSRFSHLRRCFRKLK